MRPGGFNSFIFSCKAAGAAALACSIYSLFHLPGAAWAPVSAVLVTQASLHPSLSASILRVRANLVGAFIGSMIITTLGASMGSLAFGVLLTGLICHYTHLDEGLRPAHASVVIIILTSESSVWFGSLDRVLAVLIGCLGAVVVGMLFDKVFYRVFDKMKQYIPSLDGGE